MKHKKQLIVWILRILETHSDERHPLSQIAIAKMIGEQYPCDRKTVGRNIKSLCEMGFPIVKTQKGFYMDGQAFTREEVRFVAALVRDHTGQTDIDLDDLAFRLERSLSRYYKS